MTRVDWIQLAEEIRHDPARAKIQQTRTRWANRLSLMAGQAFRSGDYTRASELIVRALALDAWQAERFEKCARAVQLRAADEGQAIAARLGLRAQSACRLAVSGIEPTDEAIEKMLASSAELKVVTRVLVTASRTWSDRVIAREALRPWFRGPGAGELVKLDSGAVLVSGNARGGDRICEEIWEAWGGQVERHAVTPEMWRASRAAGFDRDAEMVAAGADVCIALVDRCVSSDCPRRDPHGSHGAFNTARMAEGSGIYTERCEIGF